MKLAIIIATNLVILGMAMHLAYTSHKSKEGVTHADVSMLILFSFLLGFVNFTLQAIE